MMADEQVWQVALTPAQRFILVNLSHAEGQKVKGQKGRVYRRFNRAFGLVPILAAADDHEGSVLKELRLSRKPALFQLTDENIEYALELVEVERATVVDRQIGPLFDVLEDIKAKRPYETPADVPAYDASAEDWSPPKRKKDDKSVEEKIANYLRGEGETKAAELVDRGGWDRPTAPNGALAAQPEERPEA